MYEDGYSLRTVGSRFGVSHERVRQVLADYGKTLRPRGTPTLAPATAPAVAPELIAAAPAKMIKERARPYERAPIEPPKKPLPDRHYRPFW